MPRTQTTFLTCGHAPPPPTSFRREPLCRWFFQQLILAIDYCHKKGVANRDIKVRQGSHSTLASVRAVHADAGLCGAQLC